jgi:CheY-like chemotaxis protein
LPPFGYTNANMSRGRAILIVDDDATEALLIARSFRKSGVVNPAFSVLDADEAKNYLKGQGQYSDRAQFPMPGLVLLDQSLPGAAEWEVLRWIRAEPALKAMAVVVFSGSENPHHRTGAIALGANGYEVKPQTSEEYQAVLKKLAEDWLPASSKD